MSQQNEQVITRTRPSTKLLVVGLLSLGLAWATYAAAEAIVGDPVLGADDPILGSKHDFTGLNDRAGVVAMAGVAFSDYGYSCVYCHIPPEEAGALPSDFGGIDGWNRYVIPVENYQLYDSVNLDNKTSSPNSISMLCLSCHDGTMAVDMVVFKPVTFDPAADNAMHMRINPDDNIESCGKCRIIQRRKRFGACPQHVRDPLGLCRQDVRLHVQHTKFRLVQIMFKPSPCKINCHFQRAGFFKQMAGTRNNPQ